MRNKISILCLVFIGAASAINGQQDGRLEKDRFVVVPPEIGLVVIASQPDCPLRIERAKLLVGVSGGVGKSYELRSRGTKPIRSVIVADNSGSRWSWGARNTDELVMPGQSVPPWSEDDECEIVPLTDDLRDKLKLRGPMKWVLVLMVVRVEFADGTIYDDEPTFKALEAYTEDLYGKVERLEYLQRQQKQ